MQRFKDLVANNLKGSGDYSVFAFGVYNGQGADRAELNSDMHIVTRVTYPYQFAIGNIFEAGGLTPALRYIERPCERNNSDPERARERIYRRASRCMLCFIRSPSGCRPNGIGRVDLS